MAPYTHRTIDQHDRSIRQKQRDDATLDSNATKWRSPPISQRDASR
ncbi:hypothetical protein [Burkholderia gladioli]|nr:hypothetical protein [Burkholderia gladioli]